MNRISRSLARTAAQQFAAVQSTSSAPNEGIRNRLKQVLGPDEPQRAKSISEHYRKNTSGRLRWSSLDSAGATKIAAEHCGQLETLRLGRTKKGHHLVAHDLRSPPERFWILR